MSAPPGVRRLSEEELDLLLSRSLDGDLTSGEEGELAKILLADPRAARRREELAKLVGKLNALPAPASPLGLTARTNAWTAERARGFGAVWHRLGLFPPPAILRGIAALFVIVLAGMSVLRSQSVRQKAAESPEAKDDGRVAIFFEQGGPSTPSAQAPSAPSAPSVAKPLQKSKLASNEVRKKEAGKGEVATAKITSAEPLFARGDTPAVAESSGAIGGVAPAPARAEAALKNTRDAMAPAGAITAPKAARAPLAWDVTVAEAFRQGWALRRVAAPPPLADAPAVTYRIRLDAEGKVVSASALGRTTAEVDAAVRSLVFQKLAAEAPAEIEIALAAR